MSRHQRLPIRDRFYPLGHELCWTEPTGSVAYSTAAGMGGRSVHAVGVVRNGPAYGTDDHLRRSGSAPSGAKKSTGRVTGSRRLRTKGRAEKSAGHVKQAADKISDAFKH
jgi:hypothetical protein